KKLRVIRNGIPVDALDQQGKIDLPERTGDTILFGFFGRFMPQKGFDDLIDAVEILSRDPECQGKFKVLAVNDGSFVREYRNEIARRGLSGAFVFKGFVPDASALMKDLDGVVMPSLWEACGLVAMEALAAGCPLIATTCDGLLGV